MPAGHFEPVADQRIGLVLLDPGQHVFAHAAAQGPQVADRLGAHRQAQFDALGIGVGHQQLQIAPVPQLMRRDIAFEFAADRFDIGDRVEMQHHRPGQLLVDARPVLEAFVEEPAGGHDQHAFVPGADGDEAHADFLHPPGLVVDLDHPKS